jgi:hypothetical protein
MGACSQQLLIAPVTVEVDPLPASKTLWHIAVFESDGDEVDGSFRFLQADINGERNFLLDESLLRHGPRR